MTEKEEMEKEIQRVKKLIDDVIWERHEMIKDSCFRETIKDYGWGGYKQKFRKPFIDFLKKEKIDSKILKLFTSFGYKTPYSTMLKMLMESSELEWIEFSKMLPIIDEYYYKYKLDQNKKTLCSYTDCYKKLSSERICLKCKSHNPLIAMFCNMCGNKLENK